jgi:hypothetical protein
MAGDQQEPSTRPFRTGSKQWQAFKQSIDARVARHFDLPVNAFSTKVRSAQLSRREEQGGNTVYRDPEVLFRPRVEAVMAAKARFDMGNRETGLGSAEGSAERAGCVALHDDQPRLTDRCADGSGDIANVKLRVRPTGAGKLDSRHRRHAVVGRPEIGMLSGQDKPRADAAVEKRFG